MKTVTLETRQVIEAAVANDDHFGQRVAVLAHAAGTIRESCKPTDQVWANTLGMVYGILAYMTDTKDGDTELGAEWAGGTFGQKVFMAAACDLAAELGIVKRNKETGRAGKVKYGQFTVGLLNSVGYDRYATVADDLLADRLESIDKTHGATVARLHGEYHIALGKSPTDQAKLERVRDDAIAEADTNEENAITKAKANHARAIAWFKSLNGGIVAYLTAILRTLDPAGVKVGSVTYGPDAIVIACLAGFVPSAKDVANTIKSDNATIASIDQVKAEARNAKKTLGNLLVEQVEAIVTNTTLVAA